jgi:hypothetical protein
MRVAHSRFRLHSARDVGFPRFPGSPAFFANRRGFRAGLCEASPNYNWSSEVNGSIGFVVNGLWSINSRHDRRQRNQAYHQDNDGPVQTLHRTPQIRHNLRASRLPCQCATNYTVRDDRFCTQRAERIERQAQPAWYRHLLINLGYTHPMKEDVKKKDFSPPLGEMRVW